MRDATVGLTDDLTHFMPFYPITCTEEGEYADLLERDTERNNLKRQRYERN